MTTERLTLQQVEATAQSLPPEEREDYYLFVIDGLLESEKSVPPMPNLFGLSLRPAAARVLQALWDANGNIKSRDQLYSAAIVGRPHVPGTPLVVDNHLVQIRKSLRGTGYRIVNERESGWRLVKANEP